MRKTGKVTVALCPSTLPPFLHSCITILNKSRQPSLRCGRVKHRERNTLIDHLCDHGTYLLVSHILLFSSHCPYGYGYATQAQRTSRRVGISRAPKRTPPPKPQPSKNKKDKIQDGGQGQSPVSTRTLPQPLSPLQPPKKNKKKQNSTLIVRLISTAQTGFFYTTQRPRLGPKLAAVKYDPQGPCVCVCHITSSFQSHPALVWSRHPSIIFHSCPPSSSIASILSAPFSPGS